MNRARVHNDKAELLLDLDRPADAEREAREALADDPHNARAYQQLARALSRKGDVQGALDAINRNIALRPESWGGHWTAGVILYRVARDREALAAFRNARELAPDEPAVYRMLAWTHHALCEWGHARAAAAQGLTLAPDDAGLAAVLALALLELRDKAGAREQAERALRLAPEDPYVHRWYGMVALGTGRRRAASEAFRESLRMDPGWSGGPDAILRAERRRNPLDILDRFLANLRAVPRRHVLLWLAISLVLTPILVFNVLLTLLTWVNWTIQTALSLRLSRDPRLRPLLGTAELRAAAAAAAAFVLGSALVAASIALQAPWAVLPALAVLALITPVHETARLHGRRRTGFLVLTVVLAAAAAVLAPLSCITPAADGFTIMTVLIALGSTWPATLLRSR